MAEQFSTLFIDEEIENDYNQTDGQYEASQPELKRKLKRIITTGTHQCHIKDCGGPRAFTNVGALW